MQEDAKEYKIYPEFSDTFNAFKYCALDNLKVVILGQDPYHGPNQAHGLCFLAQKGIKAPPSLVNIFKELKTDIDGFEIPNHGELTHWVSKVFFFEHLFKCTRSSSWLSL